MTTQFGFIVIFGFIWPWTAPLSQLNNWIEMRRSVGVGVSVSVCVGGL